MEIPVAAPGKVSDLIFGSDVKVSAGKITEAPLRISNPDTVENAGKSASQAMPRQKSPAPMRERPAAIFAKNSLRSAAGFAVMIGASLVSLLLSAAPSIADTRLLEEGLKKGTLNFVDTGDQRTAGGCCFGVAAVWEGFYRAPARLSGSMDLSHAAGAVLWNKLHPDDPAILPENVTLDDHRTVPLVSREATKLMAAKIQRAVYGTIYGSNQRLDDLAEHGNYQTWMEQRGNDIILHSQKELASKAAGKDCIPLTAASLDSSSKRAVVHQLLGRIDKENQLWILDPNHEGRKWIKANTSVENGVLLIRYEIQAYGQARQMHWENVFLTSDYYAIDKERVFTP